MAFKSARCTRYENIQGPDGNDIAILIGGEIEDDSIEEKRYGEYWIMGPQFDSLPPADPLLDGTPEDPRFQAIQLIIGQFATALYKQWMDELAARPKVIPKPSEVLNQLPVMTQLLPDFMMPAPVIPTTGSAA